MLTDRARVPSLPAVDGLGLDAHRIPTTPHATLDDAWYDVFVVPDGRVAIACGEGGIRGAAKFFVRRLRELFFSGAGDASLSGARALLGQYGAVESATALVGFVDLERQTFAYVSAGHPAPMIRFPGGIVAQLPADWSPAAPSPTGRIVADVRGAECVLVATRGVLEAAGGDAAGRERLGQALADERLPLDSFPAVWIARHAAVDAASGGALLALTLNASAVVPVPAQPAPGWTVSWTFDATPAASNAARRAFLACLATTIPGRAPIDVAAAELIFGELLGNVVRHAPGPVDVELAWTAELPVLHVRDSGPGFRSRRQRERLPVDELSESGRGLFIISSFAAGFSVRNRPGRGTHAMATLPALAAASPAPG